MGNTNEFTKLAFYKQYDKKWHFLLLMVFCALFVIGIHNLTIGTLGELTVINLVVKGLASIGAGFTIGWLKEVVDGTGSGTKEIHDIDADAVGIYVGTVIGLLLISFIF